MLDQLLDQVDVVIDDHATAGCERVGAGSVALQTQSSATRRLCRSQPYGQSAPADRRHAEDLNVFHSSGWGYHTPSAVE